MKWIAIILLLLAMLFITGCAGQYLITDKNTGKQYEVGLQEVGNNTTPQTSAQDTVSEAINPSSNCPEVNFENLQKVIARPCNCSGRVCGEDMCPVFIRDGIALDNNTEIFLRDSLSGERLYKGLECLKGNKEGQNINYYYCDQKIDYSYGTAELILKESKISESGEITGVKEYGFSFAVDANGNIVETKCT